MPERIHQTMFHKNYLNPSAQTLKINVLLTVALSKAELIKSNITLHERLSQLARNSAL